MNSRKCSDCLLFTTRMIVLFTLVLSQLGMKFTQASASNENVSDVQQNPASSLLDKCFGDQGVQSYQELTGKINFVGTDGFHPIQLPVASLGAATPEGAARGYLSECGSLFGLKDPAAELDVRRQYQTGDGRSVVRFQQNYQGIPVFGGELIVQLNSGNEIILVNGNILPEIQLPTQPAIDPAIAQQKAL